MPSLVITSTAIDQPVLAAGYRGQDFTLLSRPDWSQLDALEWLNWLVNRRAPELNDLVILWARTDLFPGEPVTGTTP
jgi:hypothetical protein